MTVQVQDAIQTIVRILQKKHRSIHDSNRSLIDVWIPDKNGRGDFLNSVKRPSLRTPCLMADTGNLLLSVIDVQNQDKAHSDDSWRRFVNDAIRMLANLLKRAASDYGMHRLLLLMVLPENEQTADSLTAAMAQSRVVEGQFRALILPHRNQSLQHFENELERHLQLLTPFPLTQFLMPAEEFDWHAFVTEALAEGPHKNNKFIRDFEKDIQDFLRDGSWGDAPQWPTVMQRLQENKDKATSVVNKSGEQP